MRGLAQVVGAELAPVSCARSSPETSFGLAVPALEHPIDPSSVRDEGRSHLSVSIITVPALQTWRYKSSALYGRDLPLSFVKEPPGYAYRRRNSLFQVDAELTV